MDHTLEIMREVQAAALKLESNKKKIAAQAKEIEELKQKLLVFKELQRWYGAFSADDMVSRLYEISTQTINDTKAMEEEIAALKKARESNRRNDYPDDMEVEVRFESTRAAEVVAYFQDEETYLECLPALEALARKSRMVVTETMLPPPTN